MKIRHFYTSIASFFIVCCSITSALGESEFDVFIERFESFISSGKWADVYHMMDEQYRSVVTEEFFVKGLEGNDLQLNQMDSIGGNIFDKSAYLILDLNYVHDRKEYFVYSVMFCSKKDGHWLANNFPFKGDQLAEFGKLPPALSHGLWGTVEEIKRNR